jgi:2'-5' RNA ligase
MDLTNHYNQLWIQSLSRFEQGEFEYDPLIDDAGDKRFGITLIARPDQHMRENIQYFLSKLNTVEPEQYYYPTSDIHITVMSIISCHTGFDLAQIQVEDYVRLIQNSLQRVEKFQVVFRGITASPSCIIIQGFPEDDTLHNIRDNLRVNFKNTDLQQSIDKRYAIQTAHSTVVRFRKPVVQQEAFLAALKAYRDFNFGTFETDHLELVFNDWYQKKEIVKTLATFPLK